MFNIGIMCQFNGSAWVCGPNTVDTDPYFNEVTMLWHMDDRNDVIGGTNIWSVNNNFPNFFPLTHECANSVYINGTPNTLMTANGTLNSAVNSTLLATNWTMEFYANVVSHPTVQTLICKGADNGLNSDGYSEFSFDVLADGRVSYVTFPNGIQGTKQDITSTNSITYGEWLHFAVVQQGAVTSIYVGGVLFAQGSIWRQVAPYFGLRMASFCYPNFRNQSEAYFDEFRLTKNIARYTSDFTPLTRQFPYPTNLSILMLFNNGTYANDGVLSGVTGTTTGSAGTTNITFGVFYTKWTVLTLNGTESLAQASQPFDFGCDLELLASVSFPFLSKTNAVNGGTTGWEIGFDNSRIPYYKDLSTGITTACVTAAPLTTRFSFRVISDGTTHVFYINSIVAGSVVSSTATNVQPNDLLRLDNSLTAGEFNMDKFFFA